MKLPRRRTLLQVLPTALLALSAAAAAHAQDVPCGDQIAQLMNEHGQFLDTFTKVQVQPYSWASESSPQISGWRFSGVPPQCTGGTAGTVVASLWADCSVTDIYTTGNCRIPGIRDGWY